MRPLVSIIVPTCNSSKYLHFCLNSLRNQTYTKIEILVIDNYSKDITCLIAKRYGARIYTKGPERAAQLNYGIKKAQGKYIYETGSDMTSDYKYIEECVEKCEKEGYDAIYSSVISKPHHNFWSRVKGMERQCYIGNNLIEAAHFFHRKVFYEIGGFDDKIVGVEEDMQYRMDKAGYKTGRIQSRETHLHEAQSLREVAKKSFYYGHFIPYYFKRRPLRSTTYLFPLRLAYLRHLGLFIKHPILTAGFVVYKGIQLLFGGLGIAFGRFFLKNMHKEIYGKNTVDKSTEESA